jgi:hypothetical protein
LPVEADDGGGTRRRKRWLLIGLAAAVAVGLAVGLPIALSGQGLPSSYLYKESEKAFYLDWKSNGIGTLWETAVEPYNGFRVGSGQRAISVTRRGSTLSIQTLGSGSPSLGTRSGSQLALDVPSGGSGFGGWSGNFSFSIGSLKKYENAAAAVRAAGQIIAQTGVQYANADVADANQALTTSTMGKCILYLSGTDVSVTVHGADSCRALTTRYGDLGSGGSWLRSQVGANYPGQASLACEDATAHTSEYVVVADAGGKAYGSQLCSDLSNSGTWFPLRIG